MKGTSFQDMAPNAKRAFVVTLVFGAIAVILYMFVVEPYSADLAAARAKLAELQGSHERINRDLRNSDNVKKMIADTEAGLKPFRDEMLTPLLESYAMRAKSLLDPLALGAGLTEIEYSEEPFRALPLTKGVVKGRPLQQQLFTRAAIRINAKGSYQAAISFLLRLEKEHPLISLQSLDITAQQSPLLQTVKIILEWPAKGVVTRP